MRRIDADALRNEVDTWGCNDYDKYDFLEAIDNAPTVEPTFGVFKAICCEDCNKRPQGEWIFEKANNEHTDGYICSMCGQSFHTKVPYFSEYNFCPKCGADMRVKDELNRVKDELEEADND